MTYPKTAPKNAPCGQLLATPGALALDVLAALIGLPSQSATLFTAPACPATPRAPPRAVAAPAAPTPPPAINPAVLAEQYWQTIPLPGPHPTVPPGWALCGEPAYLVTGGATAPASTNNATPIGQLNITPIGTYWVNWGDGGGWSGPYPHEGLPWPNGTISHTYDTVGTATVTVRETWTATWSLGPANGTLSGLTTTATIPNLPIRQLQTVLTNN